MCRFCKTYAMHLAIKLGVWLGCDDERTTIHGSSEDAWALGIYKLLEFFGYGQQNATIFFCFNYCIGFKFKIYYPWFVKWKQLNKDPLLKV